jgi:hypothetical protein
VAISALFDANDARSYTLLRIICIAIAKYHAACETTKAIMP